MHKATVLMAVYNGERYLREAIESILSQTFQDFEFLIINDGSTDSTREVILSYDDPRIQLVDNERNLGLTRSLNRGLALAQGQFIARQDADDISERSRLAKQVAFLETHADVALLGTWYKKIDTQGNLIGKRRLPCDYTAIRWSLLFICPFLHSSVVLRKTIVMEQIGVYNEALVYSLDYELWNRIARCLPVANLNEYLVRYRDTPWSMTTTFGDRTQEGFRMRLATVVDLLGWDKTNMALNEAQFAKMAGLLFHSHVDLNLQELNNIGREILRLHTAFCQSYKIDLRDCKIHHIKLYSRLSQRFIDIAHHYFDQDDVCEARQLRGEAGGLYWPILFTWNYVILLFKLLMGPHFVRAIRRLAQKAVN